MFNIKIAAVILAVLVAGVGVYKIGHKNSPAPASHSQATKQTNSAQKGINPTSAKSTAVNYCGGNDLRQNIVVSISKQHLWACEATTSKYDSAVITGMQLYPADLTPVGTYKIYSKTTNQTLAGRDDTGSWSDFVNYWMPFLDNQYGTYGFHDLTQTDNGANGRADSDFGNVDINAPYTAAKHASHGCIELPLATAKWLYGWASVGTTVTIES